MYELHLVQEDIESLYCNIVLHDTVYFVFFLKIYLLLSPVDYFERNSIDNYITKEWHWSVCLCKCVSFRLLVSKVPPYVFPTKSSREKSSFFTTFQKKNYNKKCKLKSVSILKVTEQITLLSYF